MRVLVTGASGCLAQVLLPRLCATPGVSAVEGVDLRPCSYTHPNYRFSLTDIRSDVTSELLDKTDAVIHLAFRLTPGEQSAKAMRENNVDGTLSLFQQARTSEITHIINLSSVSVYGDGFSVTESAPLNPSPQFEYACHKAAIDEITQRDLPTITTLRAHYIVGPHSQRFLRSLAQSRFYITYPTPPVWQLIHENDVVDAILLMLAIPTPGVFNVASNTVYDLNQLFRAPSRFQIPLSMSFIRALWAVWSTINPGVRGGWLHTAVELMNTSLTVNCSALRALGWQSTYEGNDLKSSLLL